MYYRIHSTVIKLFSTSIP